MIPYRLIPRYANSDLSEYRNQLFNIKPMNPEAKALVFGTQFHALLLENKQAADLTPATCKQLTAMREAVLANPWGRKVIEHGLVELGRFWLDAVTDLPCKAQTDIWVDELELIVDIKTTSARTYGEFLDNCERYNYDRQAAFYLDSTPDARRFIILGVQKQAPHQIFFFEPTADRSYVEGGRKKYQALLRDIKRTGFTPSSWKGNLLTA